MTRSEWVAIAQRMRASWPHAEIPDATLAVWWEEVGDLDAQAVASALRTYARDGREFPPTGGMLRARVVSLTRAELDHGEAWALAMEAVRRFGTYAKAEAMEWLAERSETTARAASQIGFIELCTFELANVETVRAQFRGFYNAAADRRRREATYAGLPGIAPKSIEGKPRTLGAALARIAEGKA